MVLRGGGLSLLSREPAPGFSAFPAGWWEGRYLF